MVEGIVGDLDVLIDIKKKIIIGVCIAVYGNAVAEGIGTQA